MSATIARLTTEIPSIGGTYIYDEDLFADAMKRTVAELWKLYKGEFGYDARIEVTRPGERSAHRKLRKAQLAAIIAWKWTNVRDAQRAEEAAEELTLQTATPVEIDARIARIEAQAASVRDGLERIDRRAAAFERADEYHRHVTQEQVEKDAKVRPQLEQRLYALRDLVAPLHAEFTRRGGWTRWYLVKHLHRDVDASRCSRRPTSDHYWVTEYSGKSEAEVIELAGTLVCTTCFPDAPVTSRPPHPRLMTPAQAHVEALKEAKAREKAAKEASWVRLPDGELLFAVRYDRGEFENDGQLKTERAANNRMVSDASDLVIWFDPNHPDAPGWVETIRRCVLALAHLRNLPPIFIFDELVEKMVKKSKQNGRFVQQRLAKVRDALSV